MFDSLMSDYGSRFLLAAGGVGIGLLLLVVVLWVMRNRAPSPFVRGGRNRQPRLQVLDAAAVDARRRLVLVRRDNVEHLVMIGGPTDIVIESRILPGGEAEIETPIAVRAKAAVAQQEPVAPRPITPPAPVRESVAIAEELPSDDGSSHVRAMPTPPRPTPPVEIERAPRPAPILEARPQPQSFARPEPAPIEPAAAAEILDSARQRVLPNQRLEPTVVAPAITPPPVAPTPAPRDATIVPPPVVPTAQPSDFQRVLEEEMTSNLTAERLVPQQQPVPNRAPPVGSGPRRDPDMAPITGADAALQNEVARIFGEMSVNRDK
ncbi:MULTISPECIES: flagellar biosynthetic protein FliO [Rhizobium]|nr:MULTISPECIES: flagellar biosynthetic protein FliO [Rhizobium]